MKVESKQTRVFVLFVQSPFIFVVSFENVVANVTNGDYNGRDFLRGTHENIILHVVFSLRSVGTFARHSAIQIKAFGMLKHYSFVCQPLQRHSLAPLFLILVNTTKILAHTRYIGILLCQM